jgi:hypothetical protein
MQKVKKIDRLGKLDIKGVAKRFASYAASIHPKSDALKSNRNSFHETIGSLEDLQHYK